MGMSLSQAFLPGDKTINVANVNGPVAAIK